MSNQIVIYIANRGTPLNNGGESKVGHMWLGLSKNGGPLSYYGFSPIEEGNPDGPGAIHTDDNSTYKTFQYSRVITLTDKQYEAINNFVNEDTTPFDLYYKGLTNSCVDFVWGAVNAGGLNPNNIDPDVWPGNNPNDIDRLTNPVLDIGPIERPSLLPPWLAPVGGMFNDVPAIPILLGGGDPLVLDLDGDGVEVSRLGYGTGASTVYFDMDNDGFAERTSWVTGGDGLLALDKNGNGKIDNQGELFGNNNIVTDGFSNLKTLDSNNDNKITSADAQFANLRVWVDADNDGITDVGELKTLASLKITQINLGATILSGVENNENIVAATSSFVMNGVTRTINEVWFRNDAMDTRYQGNVTLDVRTLFLPTLKGFGNLKDLHVAMSQDASLLTLVQKFVSSYNINKFANPTALDNEIRAILYKWAGVENVVAGSCGTFIDAKILTFMEVLTGSPYGTNSTLGFTQPSHPVHVPPVMNGFEIAFDTFKTQLLAQSGAGSLFTVAPTYNLATGELSSGVLSTSAINSLKTYGLSLASSARDGFWQSVTEYVLNIKDKTVLTTTETNALNTAIVAMGTGQTWESISTTVLSQYSASYRATNLSDNVVGLQGDESLNSLGGDDILNGRTGNDYLYGGSDNDTYIFKVGDGQDMIYEESGTDTISMGAGITASNIRFEKVYGYYGNQDLNIYYGTSDKITLYNQFYDDANGSTSYDEIETLKFADGSTINLKGGLTFTGTSSSDGVYGTSMADLLNGLAGDDSLFGNGGNDILNGGAGNDYLDGGDGTDTVTYAGNGSAVTVNLSLTSAQNTIGAGADTLVSIENLIGSSYNDTLTGDGNANTVEGGLGNDILNGGAGIDTVSYSSATSAVIVNLATTVAQNTVGAGTDAITAFENILGSAYNDTLTGNSGANIITGGNGNDLIQGGLGNDVLIGGNGVDTVSYTAATAAVSVNLATTTAQNTLSAGTDTLSGFENILGSGFNDTLAGDGNNNVIEGGLGNDILNGGLGTDTVSYASATAAVTVNLATTTAQNTVGAGTDTLSNFENIYASAFSDRLTGSSAANQIEGNAGNDVINGGAGNDILVGGLGADTLTGGLDADTFKFMVNGLDANSDHITDFSKTQGDKIDIKDLLIGYDALTSVIANFVDITTSGANSIMKVDRDGAGTTYGWQQIAIIDNVTGLTDEAALKASGNLIVA